LRIIDNFSAEIFRNGTVTDKKFCAAKFSCATYTCQFSLLFFAESSPAVRYLLQQIKTSITQSPKAEK